MEIMIDLEKDLPVFSQLIEQVKYAVLEGGIKPGDALPSIRQLAGDLDVNSKTVAKAYRRLERDAVIQSKGYRGSFVHPDAMENSQVDINSWVSEKCKILIDELRCGGATDSEIRIAFKQAMKLQN